MKEENKEIIEEVNDEIESALKDSKGLVAHQRRLTFSFSLVVVALIENYLEKLQVLKQGAKINHRWFKKSKENVKRFIANQLTCPVEKVKELDEVLSIANKIEQDKDLLAYGKPTNEKNLRDKIDLFLSLKKRIEND